MTHAKTKKAKVEYIKKNISKLSPSKVAKVYKQVECLDPEYKRKGCKN
jgi:hypothetical protein